MATSKTQEEPSVDSPAEGPTEIAVRGPFRLTATGVIASGSPTFKQWELALKWCEAAQQASPWWVADLLAYGEKTYGSTYAAAIDATKYTEESLRNLKSIAKAVQLSRRRDNLSFTHHAEVASLPPQQQDYWLDKAETEELSTHALRRQIHESKAEHSVVAPRKTYVVQDETATIEIKAPYSSLRDEQQPHEPDASNVEPPSSEVTPAPMIPLSPAAVPHMPGKTSYRVTFRVEGKQLDRVKATAVTTFGVDVDDLQVEKLGPETRADRFASARRAVLSEVEDLKEELQAWRDALPENLQSGSKADELDAAIDQLDTLWSALDDLEWDVEFPGW